MLRVLLLEDGGGESKTAMTLMQRGYVVAVAPSSTHAWDRLGQFSFDWLLCIRKAAGGEVDTFLKSLREPDVDPVGCRLLLVSPPPLPDDLISLPLDRAVALEAPASIDKMLTAMEGDRTRPSKQGGRDLYKVTETQGHVLAPGAPEFVGNAPAVLKLLRQIERVASSDASVLISGESGSGKELVAKAVHYCSPRASKALISLNCGAIPPDLLESELFGHVKGAFTGAITDRPGRFSLAHGGTFFLDEIGELPLNLQVKLLRVLEDGEITPLGSTKSHRVNVRVVAATNRDLEQQVERKLFREDLFYRLAVLPLKTPPLRERVQDIPELINYFIGCYNKESGTGLQGFTHEALQALLFYSWPGNIRELKNFIYRLAILNDDDIVDLKDLPEKIQRCRAERVKAPDVTLPKEGLKFYEAVEQFEKALILQALERTKWNKNQAAQLLDMNRTTLVEKIKKQSISRDGGETES